MNTSWRALLAAKRGRAKPVSRLIWLTNIPTTYRLPLWAELSTLLDLQVLCMAEREPNRDWDLSREADALGIQYLHAPAMTVSRELALYLPTARLMREVALPGTALLIDGWESPGYMAAAAVCRARGNLLALSYRAAPGSHRFRSGPVAWARLGMARAADVVFAGGPGTTAVLSAMPLPKGRIVEIPNVVDGLKIHEAVTAARQRSVPRAGGHAFLYVGQLVERKNVASALQAFAQMCAPDDTFDIVGNGPLSNELLELVTQLGLASGVRLLGHLEGGDLTDAFARSNTLVLPSRKEVWGLAAAEALAAGLHVVLSDQTGAAAALAGSAGVFISKPDLPSLAAAMRESRAIWRGPIDNPRILDASPKAVAADILAGLHAAQERRDPRLSGLRVAWLTNFQAPYREPLWAALSQRTSLQVYLLFDREPRRHWIYRASTSYRSAIPRSRRLPTPLLKADPYGDQRVAVAWRDANRIVRGADVVVIGGWDQPAYLQVALLAALHSKPTVAFYESTTQSHRYRTGLLAAVRRRFFSHVTHVLAAGPASTAALVAFGTPRSKISETVNSVDVDFFAQAARLREAGLPEGGSHHFLYVGQLIARKNVETLLRAFASMPAADLLTIAGDGDLLNDLRRLADELDIASRVDFIGFQDPQGLLPHYARAQTLVLPTHEDVWGMVVNEALAAGLHTVVSDRAGVASALVDVPQAHVCGVDEASVTATMRRSRETWMGWLPPPPSLTIDRVVADVENALQRARAANAR